jgi:hypothetical protein
MADWGLKAFFTVQHCFPILQSNKFLYIYINALQFLYFREKYTKMDLIKDHK